VYVCVCVCGVQLTVLSVMQINTVEDDHVKGRVYAPRRVTTTDVRCLKAGWDLAKKKKGDDDEYEYPFWTVVCLFEKLTKQKKLPAPAQRFANEDVNVTFSKSSGKAPRSGKDDATGSEDGEEDSPYDDEESS
jgi:hypothetical protein